MKSLFLLFALLAVLVIAAWPVLSSLLPQSNPRAKEQAQASRAIPTLRTNQEPTLLSARAQIPRRAESSSPVGNPSQISEERSSQVTPAALLEQARKMVDQADLPRAEKLYREVLKLDSNQLEGHLELGLLCGDLGNFQCAQQHLREARRLRPNDDQIVEMLAAAYRDAGDYNAALKLYRQLVRKNPSEPRFLFELGLLLEALQELESAIVVYQDFLQVFPKDPLAPEVRVRLQELQPEGSEPPWFSVALRRSGSALLVRGGVEKAQDVEFLLDTGSTLTIISTELADELGFIPDSPELPLIRLETAGGTVQAPLISLDSVQLGDAVVYDVRAAIFDIDAADPVDGILGLSFLENFRVTIDHDNQSLLLEPTRCP